jgi:hypothetical protein
MTVKNRNDRGTVNMVSTPQLFIYRGDGERTGRARGIGVSPKFELLEIHFLGVTTGFSRLGDIRTQDGKHSKGALQRSEK